MPRVGFKHTIPLFERAKTVHALNRAATVIVIQSTLPISNILASWASSLWNQVTIMMRP
jgi:hypothetical protein